ncbi:MAG TPA: flagellar hook-length control protein FliK [Sphingomonas sp.]|jgi:hypothetical protein|nr:flagellar hook-length control protein FliK [Sphingomonas sp.]
MSISISPAPAAKPAGPEAATPGKGADVLFNKLIGAVAVQGADTPVEPQPAPGAKPADQALDALLAALRLSLTPGTVRLSLPGKKAGVSEKTPQARGKTNEDGELQDAAAALLAALNLPTTQPPEAIKTLSGQAREVIDDVLAKASSSSSLTSFGDTTPLALPAQLPADLAALVDQVQVKAPDQSSPVNARIDRLVDTARDAAWLDRLSQDIAASAGSGDRLRFKMMPPNLGALDVSVERHAAGMSVSMTTHTTDARNLITDSRQQMVDSLKAQGVPLVQLSLSTAGEDLERHRPPTFFNHIIEAAPASGTDLAAQPVVSTTAERVGRFA